MSQLQQIESTLRRAAGRRRLAAMWGAFWRGLLLGGSIWLLAYGIYKVVPFPPLGLALAAVLAGAVLLGTSLRAALGRASLLETARWVDDRQNLQERLSTALEISKDERGEWKELLLRDAARHAGAVDPSRLSPLKLPTAARWALLVVVLGAGLGFVPEYRTQRHLRKQADLANIRETAQRLAEFTRRQLQERPPALEPTRETLATLAEFGDQMSKASLTRGDALRDLQSAADKLREQASQLSQNPALKSLERAAREAGGSGGPNPEALQRQMEGLQKNLGNAAADAQKLDALRNDLQKARQELDGQADQSSAAAQAAREQLAKSLAALGEQMKEMGQDLAGLDEAIKALENNQTDLALQGVQAALTDLDKLRDMAQALKALAQQLGQVGKDLAEQLEKGHVQAAQQSLKKMVEQLKEAPLAPEQLEKILDEVRRAVEPGREYGKAGDFLNAAVRQMQGGQKTDAAESLASAAKELDKLMQELGDAESLLAGLDALERAQMAIASGKSWSETQGGGTCKACLGAGCSKCKGRRWGQGGGGAAGVGTWADEEGWTYWEETGPVDNSGIQRPDMDSRGLTDRPANLNPNLLPDKVRGQMSPGGPMPSITLKGVSIKGQSNVKFEEAAATAQQEAQAALNQDQVPRAYRDAVRDYFDDLKK